MKKLRLLSTLLATITLIFPLKAFADATTSTVLDYSPIIITEVQTGAVTAADEFVELYNTSDDEIDITGWQLRYQKVNTASSTLLATIDNGSDQVTIMPHGYYVVHSPSVALDDLIAQQNYVNQSITNTDKTIGLFQPDPETCKLVVRDAVAWGVSGAVLNGEGAALVSTGSLDRLLQLYVDSTGKYIDTNSNVHDFGLQNISKSSNPLPIAAKATPGKANGVIIPSSQPITAASDSTMSAVNIDNCTVPLPPPPPPSDPVDPILPPIDPAPTDPTPANDPNLGLLKPQITELLPNPGSPRTDTDDEFVEIYNPNDAVFDLSGYTLKTGNSFTFPAGTLLPPKSFTAFFSSNINISLTNSGGQVSLLDPEDVQIDQTDSYSDAKDDQAWALVDGKWQWTLTPTPNSQNVLQAEPAKTAAVKVPAKAKAATTKKAAVKGAATTKASTKKKSANAPAKQTSSIGPAQSPNSLHPRVLALVGGFALLYGAYEYRRDIANKFNQFRANRANRREDRE